MIDLHGVSVHNLKHVSLRLRQGELIVFTGVSGSGKSSMAFDTIYVEGQRRYIDSLSAHAKRYMGDLPKPDALSLEGIPPTIAIEQKAASHNPRSTVGTITAIYDYLRVLFARLATPHCPISLEPVTPLSKGEIARLILKEPKETKLIILAPLLQGSKGEHKEFFSDLMKRGFLRVRVDGLLYYLSETIPKLDKTKPHTIDVVIDRIDLSDEHRLLEAIHTGLDTGKGLLITLNPDTHKETLYSEFGYSKQSGKSYKPLEPEDFSFNHPKGMCGTCQGLGCKDCQGSRLKPYPREARFYGKRIADITALSVQEALTFFHTIEITNFGFDLLQEITGRLQFLHNVGLDYLSLNRIAPTLSGGEMQRVRLASQIGFGLVGVTYILDEPSIGLHPRDNERLIKTLLALRDRGNTVIVVEHDEETIRAADTIVDFGPLAGTLGGEILVNGSLDDLLHHPSSLTGAYLSRRKTIPTPKKRTESVGSLWIRGARHHNLKQIDVEIPLGLFTGVIGVSGSGKSSLINDILYPALSNHLHDTDLPVGEHDGIDGIDLVDKVIAIDQSPIGRTPRSNPATYVGLFNDIRDLYASLPLSLASGYTPGHFSFNVREGSCYQCLGMGMLRIDMDFLEDEWLTCPNCKGKRFDQKTLSVLYKGKSIYDVLSLTIEEGALFFADIPTIKRKLDLLVQVGLGYLQLGQSATTLSGGEAQRIKLAKELIRPPRGHTLYILDEPTTGLHFHDIANLLNILQRLVDSGNTVLVIEHNLDLIKTVDHIIELGPEGGNGGGYLVSTRYTPTLKTEKSHGIQPITELSITGASQNNLKNVSLTIPHNAMVVFTGPSGSGKTSLAFETIYAEGQRRYIESLSTYAKRFVHKCPKAKVESIEGLSPAIAIEHHVQNVNPRSTLGTITEIYDYLRVVFARLGNEAYPPLTPERILQTLLTYPRGSRLQILAPVTSFPDPKEGFVRVRVDGIYRELDSITEEERQRKHTIEVVLDRIILQPGAEKRILDALTHQQIIVDIEGTDLSFDLSHRLLTPQTFSFNAADGMCPTCSGLGLTYGANLNFGDYTLSELLSELMGRFITKEAYQFLEKTLHPTPFHIPIKDLQNQELIFLGHKDDAPFRWIGLNKLFEELARTGNAAIREEVAPFLTERLCSECQGARLNAFARSIRIHGTTLPELCNLTLAEALFFIQTLHGDGVLQEALHVVTSRLTLLCNMGLEYLSLARAAPSLSGGEVQRTRLAKQLGLGLTGVLYVLDEPTVGLHPHNNMMLNKALKQLQQLNNTLVLVEHDPLTIHQADCIYDFVQGTLTAQGTPQELMHNPLSLTGAYLSGKKQVPRPEKRREVTDVITLSNVSKHNICDLSVSIPKHLFTCVTGVSGSGKSTLIHDLFLPIATEHFDTIITIDQGTHKTTNRSDILTYSELLAPLRHFFASLPDAKIKGLIPSNFSYNHPNGMCKKCRGLGVQKIELEFLANAYIPCDGCNGFKLNPLSLTIRYKGKHLGHLFSLTVEEAKTFLPPIPKLHRILDRLILVGLGYLTLGQETQVLSTGEFGRLRLSRELSRPVKHRALYVFDEPTSGLHFDDIAKLIPVFHSLVDKGATLLIIEHNMDVIANADYIIDLGPGAGPHGGKLLASAPFDTFLKTTDSVTAYHLAKHVQTDSKALH